MFAQNISGHDSATIAALSLIVIFLDSYSFIVVHEFGIITILLFCIHILFCACIPLFPTLISCIIVVYYMFCLISPDFDASSITLGSCLAIFLVCLRLPTWAATALTLSMFGVLSAVEINEHVHFGAWVIVTVIQAFCCVAGFAVKQRRQAVSDRERNLYLQSLHSRLEQSEREIRIARHLHDTLTNNLSAIIATSNLQMKKSDDDDVIQYASFVHDRAVASMQKAHEIIDMLRHPRNEDSATADMTSMMRYVRITSESVKNELESNGLHGEIVITDKTEHPNLSTSEVFWEICDLINELGHNIARYGSGNYVITLDFSEVCTLVAMNEINAHPVAHRSGRGLSLHKKTISILGGVIQWHKDNGMWVVQARIPLKPRAFKDIISNTQKQSDSV